MSHEKQRIELPQGWKKINFYSLNFAYGFAVLFALMQLPSVSRILIKAFGVENYDTANGWVLIFLLITASGAGILSFVRMASIKKVISVIEKENDGDNANT